MLKKDYFTAILEQLARAIRQLFNMDYKIEPEAFINEANRIFEEIFDITIADIGNKSSATLDNFLNSDADKNPVTLLLLKTAIAMHGHDPDKGAKVFNQTMEKLILTNRTFSFVKTDDELEIEKLLIEAKGLYR